MDTFSAPHFTSDEAARKFLSGLRWPGGPVCPHCGVVNHAYAIERVGKTGKPAAFGVYRCAERVCRKDFSVTTGTVMERSHIALHKWLQGFYMMASAKKGVSAHQLHRTLGITYKAAWFMAHRIREAMRAGGLVEPMGGSGKVVEADETYFGKTSKRQTHRTSGERFINRGHKGPANKRAVVALVERGGTVRSFHVARADKKTVTKIVTDNVSREARLHTDESLLYGAAKEHVSSHEKIRHSRNEYVRGDVTTNSVEGFFSIFKRGMVGTYQHCSEKHLHRYLSEFDFRYNNRIALGVNDEMRANNALKGIEGKRLTYRQPD